MSQFVEAICGMSRDDLRAFAADAIRLQKVRLQRTVEGSRATFTEDAVEKIPGMATALIEADEEIERLRGSLPGSAVTEVEICRASLEGSRSLLRTILSIVEAGRPIDSATVERIRRATEVGDAAVLLFPASSGIG